MVLGFLLTIPLGILFTIVVGIQFTVYSRSSVSRRFIEASAERLQAFRDRDLSAHEFVGLIVDGKTIATLQMIVALGGTIDGEKILVDFVQATTENAQSIQELFRRLLERGFDPTSGLLVVIDGAKGLRKAITAGAEIPSDLCDHEYHRECQ